MTTVAGFWSGNEIALKPPGYLGLQANLQSVIEVAKSAGCDKATVKQGYISSKVLEYVDVHADILPSPLMMWQVCSGFAHGRQWASLGMNDVEINPGADEGVSVVRTTTDYKRLLTAGWPASQLMAEVVRLFTDLSRRPLSRGLFEATRPVGRNP
jgi:hypothetical protein